MFVKNVKVSNFKSYERMDLDLGMFNVVVGANASGKSNFTSIFRFLRDLQNHGLDNAISMQGGVEHIRNVNLGVSKDLSANLHFGFDGSQNISARKKGKELISIAASDLEYEIDIEFYKKKMGYRIHEEKIAVKVDIMKVTKRNGKLIEQEKTGEGAITIANNRGKLELTQDPKELLRREEVFPPFLPERVPLAKESMLSVPIFPILSFFIGSYLSSIAIYDFDPKLSKKAVLVSGKTELESDGSNLAITLKSILDSKQKRQKFFNLVKDFLPFLESASIERLVDRTLLTCFRESYSGKKSLPASLISDGTINICALVTSLFFERKPFVIFEEPDRNIHPYLISKLVDTMKDVSERLKKQIIVTTHNPQVVKYAGFENLLLVSRDHKGFSIMTKPSEKRELRTFLENEIGIDEIFAQGLFE